MTGLPTSQLTLALFGMPGGSELIIVAFIALLLFGNRLPGAMKSLGQSFVAFKKGMKEDEEPSETESPNLK
ncbi:MAG: twin-arginine translocase TatA/TatE family subunit [Planctomycetaceae bacterium]|nr:twin-arginine translocase TatA/TatE family subunit [Planctomycetaceae bacterium]